MEPPCPVISAQQSTNGPCARWGNESNSSALPRPTLLSLPGTGDTNQILPTSFPSSQSVELLFPAGGRARAAGSLLQRLVVFLFMFFPSCLMSSRRLGCLAGEKLLSDTGNLSLRLDPEPPNILHRWSSMNKVYREILTCSDCSHFSLFLSQATIATKRFLPSGGWKYRHAVDCSYADLITWNSCSPYWFLLAGTHRPLVCTVYHRGRQDDSSLLETRSGLCRINLHTSTRVYLWRQTLAHKERFIQSRPSKTRFSRRHA